MYNIEQKRGHLKININKSSKKKIFFLCWAAYVMAYLCRNNLSIAIPVLGESLGFSTWELGLLGSLFFWVYGIGQLINGSIGDKVPTVPFISLGLFVSGLLNVLFGLSDNLIIMSVVWALNGYFLSMLWGPIMKTFSHIFSSRLRSQIAVGMSTSMVVGFLLAWGLVGWLLVYLKWTWAFILPGILMIAFSICFYILLGKLFKQNDRAPQKKTNQTNLSFFEVFSKTKLIFIVIACMAQGVIKDGIALWAPTIIIDTHNLELSSTIGYILFIPLINLLGMFLASILNKKYLGQEKKSALVLFVLNILFLVMFILLGNINPIITIALLSLSSAMMYGSNTILLGIVPISYQKYNKTSTVAGVLDFSSYMSVGFFTLICGIVITKYSWAYIVVFWIIISVIAVSSLILSINSDKNKKMA